MANSSSTNDSKTTGFINTIDDDIEPLYRIWLDGDVPNAEITRYFKPAWPGLESTKASDLIFSAKMGGPGTLITKECKNEKEAKRLFHKLKYEMKKANRKTKKS